ncbi:hypothetical protein A0J57_08890 [Sphingobium sp. 22B]|uniref:hypothetical protein n=1 Tax=unclassified Sphingobium TaxID=2611147 RepID=UPI00078606B1|nr:MULTISPECIES: hypothetical protein [unclassified Sphingobium]KXU32655.1 hypothetical protein AXW74_06380 [Sphingobium sp. AM]KYC32732.1 hypothetical protein A0J57_08890 [Sphingobium sp. 22B]OAP31621.1 hypothetical protein A8O16_12345 [Sphingobium sp. 20006FA]
MMPTAPHHILLSGHSLTDGAYPAHLRRVMDRSDMRMHVETRNKAGSTIAMRIDEGLLDDLRHAADAGSPFDMLIVTEQHTLLGNIVWNDSIANLTKVHDRFISHNGKGSSFLLSSWLNIDDPADPRRWIDVEAAMAPVWYCVVMRINRLLAAQGRSDRIQLIPAAAAMAWLVQRATADEEVAGIGTNATAQTVRRLFVDDVHPTALSSWFVALVTEASIYRRMPEDHQPPPGISDALNRSLRILAWQFVDDYFRTAPPSPEDCRRHVLQVAIPQYLAYQRDGNWRHMGKFAAYWKWLRHRLGWQIFFSIDPRSGLLR